MNNGDDFFDNLSFGKSSMGDAAFETDLTASEGPQIQDHDLNGDYFTSVRNLIPKRPLEELMEMVAGTRVAFVADLDAMLTYGDAYPDDGLEGSVVAVRSASGDLPGQDGWVNVLWDDHVFRKVLARHVKPGKRRHAKVGDPVRIVTSSLGDLTALFGKSASSTDLVHMSSKDLWSFRKEGEQYVLERLFDNNGSPLKEG